MPKAKIDGTEGQSGEVMLEAAIIFIPVLILVMAMLSLFFWFYQEAMMTSIAAEIAENVAQNVQFGELGINAAPALEDYSGQRMFRLSFGSGAVESDQRDRAEAHASWRIPLSTLGLSSGAVDVDCDIQMSGIGRAYVKVTVRQPSEIFLGGVLELAGIADSSDTFGGTAYAECVDLMGYTSMVNFVEYSSTEMDTAFGAVGMLYTSVKKLLKSVGF